MAKAICEFCGREFKTPQGLKLHTPWCEKNPDKNIRPPKSNGKYHCQYCNRILKTSTTLDTHEKYCSRNPANKKTEIVNGEEVLTTDQKIIDLFIKLNGRTVANRLDLEYMNKLFCELYPNSKLQFSYDCPSCVSHLYNKLKEHYEKIK